MDQSGPTNTEPSRREKVLQPTGAVSAESSIMDTSQNTLENIDVSSVYPDLSKVSQSQNFSPAQSVALASTELHAKEANRLVCMRVKAVLIISILLAISGISGLVSSFSAIDQTAGMVTLVLSLIQLSLAVGMVVSKDHNNVGLIIKIFLVLQVFNVLFSIANPLYLVINVVGLLLLSYAYIRVKSLS